MLWADSLVSSCRDFQQRLMCSQFWLLLFTPAGFMQNSSSMIFQIFPSGSHQASLLATLSSLKTPLMSASSISMSPITGKSLSHTHRRSHVFIYSPIDRSLWSLGATCAVLQVSECRHGVALRSQWEQQYGGGHWLPATGMAVYINTNCSHHRVAAFILFLFF